MSTDKGLEAVMKAKKLLSALSKGRRQARAPVAAVLDLLRDVERDMGRRKRRQTAPPASPTKGTGVVFRYHVEGTGAHKALVQTRAGSKAPPARCLKAVYDQTAEVVAGAAGTLSFDDLARSVAASMPTPPGDTQIRVALRFWLLSCPPLVKRLGARYRRTSPSFGADAARVWRQAAKGREPAAGE